MSFNGQRIKEGATLFGFSANLDYEWAQCDDGVSTRNCLAQVLNSCASEFVSRDESLARAECYIGCASCIREGASRLGVDSDVPAGRLESIISSTCRATCYDGLQATSYFSDVARSLDVGVRHLEILWTDANRSFSDRKDHVIQTGSSFIAAAWDGLLGLNPSGYTAGELVIVVSGCLALVRCFCIWYELYNFEKQDWPSLGEMAFKSPKRIGAETAFRRRERVDGPRRSVVWIDEVLYDRDGAYAPVEINGVKTNIRVMPTKINELRLAAAAVLPPIETAGKEAALVSSLRPKHAAFPKGQLSISLDGKHLCFAIRADAKTLITVRHGADQFTNFAGTVTLELDNKLVVVTKWHPTGRFPVNSDLAAFLIEPGVFATLGVAVARFGFPISGPAAVHAFDDLAQTTVGFGRLSKGQEYTGILEHNCWTKPGASGAPVLQDGVVVAIHTGSDPTGQRTNLATSTRYLQMFLGVKLDETFYRDGEWDRDPQYEEFLNLFHNIAVKNQGRNKEVYEAADDIWTEFSESRFGEHFLNEDERQERLDRLDLADATKLDVKKYFEGKALKGGSGKKAARKFGMQSSKKEAALASNSEVNHDIKGGSSSSATTSSAMEKSKMSVSDSNLLASLEASERQNSQERAKLSKDVASLAATIVEMQNLLKLSLLTTSPVEAQNTSSKACDSKPPVLSNQKIAIKAILKKDTTAQLPNTQ